MPLIVALFLALTNGANAQKDTLFFPPYSYFVIENEEWVIRETNSSVKLRKKDNILLEAKARYREPDSLVTPDNFIEKIFEENLSYKKLSIASRSKLDEMTYLLELVPNIDECSEFEIPKEFLTMKLFFIVRYINPSTIWSLELDDDIYIFLQSLSLKDYLLDLYACVRFTNPKELDELMGYPLSSERVNYEVNKKYQSFYKQNYQELLQKRKCYDDESLLETLKSHHPTTYIDSLARFQNDSTLAHLYAVINASSGSQSIQQELQKLADAKYTHQEYSLLFEKSKKAEFKLEDYLDLVFENYQENEIKRLLELSIAADKRIDKDDYKIIAADLIKKEEKLDNSFDFFGLDKIDDSLAIVNYGSLIKGQTKNYFILQQNGAYIRKSFEMPEEKISELLNPGFTEFSQFLDSDILKFSFNNTGKIVSSKNKSLLLLSKLGDNPHYYISAKMLGSEWKKIPTMNIDSSAYLVVSNYLGNKERYGAILWDNFTDQTEKKRLEKIITDLTGNSLDYYCRKDSLGKIISINDEGADIIRANMKPEYLLLTSSSIADVDGDKQDELVHVAISNGKILTQSIFKLNNGVLEKIPAKNSLKILEKNTAVLNALLISQIKNHTEEKLDDPERLFGFDD